MPVPIAVAEDHLIVREGVRQLLEGDPRIEVVAAVGDVDALREACERERPDVVITDIRMPPTETDEGIKLAEALRESIPRPAWWS